MIGIKVDLPAWNDLILGQLESKVTGVTELCCEGEPGIG